MIESGGTAPYAPAAAVIGVIRAYRERPVRTPIDNSVLEMIGVSASLAPRTHQALRLLDLIDDDGNPTTAMQDLRKAGASEYPKLLAETVRTAYAEVFTYADPSTDDVEKIRDIFRHFEPVGMRDRMVRLFYGLCEEAEIIQEAPRVSRAGDGTNGGSGGRQRRTRVAPVRDTSGGVPEAKGANRSADAPQPSHHQRGDMGAIPGAEHLAIRGLLMTLPEVGAVWPDEKRREWADAMLAAFNLIYIRPTEAQVVTTRTTVNSKEAQNG